MDDSEPTMSDPTSRSPSKPARPRGGPLGWILVYTRGLIVDQHLRRLTMFYVVLTAMLMAFCGDLFLGPWLQPREHFYRFAVYWLLCGWLTMLAALLAIYDILLLRVQHRLVRRQLRQRVLGEDDPTGPGDEK